MTPPNNQALHFFMDKKESIDAMLERLKGLSAEHFGQNPGAVTWSDVADIGYLDNMLKTISDRVFNEGES